MFSCAQNWSIPCEKALNKQINHEYSASLHYHFLSSYFSQATFGLQTLSNYFNKCSREEREHADMLMKYQTKRGGTVQLEGIPQPNIDFKTSNHVLEAIELAYNLEKDINTHLLNLHKVSSEQNDAQFCDYLEGHFLNEQVESIYELTQILNIIQKMDNNFHDIWNFLESRLS
mgnify:CR=1 FL=1|tara:strand:+ start:325 stop:843 length:519 start_codon:yes stop_codon:yes gene_type:complete